MLAKQTENTKSIKELLEKILNSENELFFIKSEKNILENTILKNSGSKLNVKYLHNNFQEIFIRYLDPTTNDYYYNIFDYNYVVKRIDLTTKDNFFETNSKGANGSNSFFIYVANKEKKEIDEISEEERKCISKLMRGSNTLRINETNCFNCNRYSLIFDRNGIAVLFKNTLQKEKIINDIILLFLLCISYNFKNEKYINKIKDIISEYQSIENKDNNIPTVIIEDITEEINNDETINNSKERNDVDKNDTLNNNSHTITNKNLQNCSKKKLTKKELIKRINEIKTDILFFDFQYYFKNPVKPNKIEYYPLWEFLSGMLKVDALHNEVKTRSLELTTYLELYYKNKQDKNNTRIQRILGIFGILFALFEFIFNYY